MANLALYPPTAILTPEQFQDFEAQGSSPPSYWYAITNGVVASDISVTPSDFASQVLAYGVYQLRQGIGSVTWTVDLSAMPATSGKFGANLQDADSLLFAGFEYQRSINQIRVYNQGGNIATIPVTLASGDQLVLEIAGSVWRFSVFGSVTQVVPFTPPAGIKYPCFYAATLVPPLIPSSRLLPPSLVGDWSYLKSPDWTASGGTITPVSGTARAHYYAGVANVGVDPGVYIVTASYAGSQYEQATATVTVQALRLLTPATISLSPGAQYQFDTNYDETAQQFSWTVSAGTITASGLYTAPTAPGTYTVSANYKTQKATATVTVGASISPTVTSAAPGEIIQFTSNLPGTVTWSATCGSINSSSGVWTAPSTPGVTCNVSAYNGTTTVTQTISVLDFFPYDPSVSFSDDITKHVIFSMAEDGSRTARVKNKLGRPQRKYELTFRNRDATEYLAAEAFWQAHHPDRTFIFQDKILGLNVECYFDSDLHSEPQAGCPIDYSFRLIER